MVQRSLLLERLEKWRGKPIVKVLTGVRRCGKSVLLKQFQEALLASGVAPDRIVSVDFEDLSNEFLLDSLPRPCSCGRMEVRKPRCA